MGEFARKTGDYSQLSGVDLQVLGLLYDLEVEAAKLYDNEIGHVRTEPKRVLGVSVKAMHGDGKRDVKSWKNKGGWSGGGGNSVADGSSVSVRGADSIASNTAFFHGNADGIIDAANVDYDEEDDDDDGDRVIVDNCGYVEENQQSKPKSWAVLVNSQKASNAPLVDYSLPVTKEEEPATLDLDLKEPVAADAAAGQFDDASTDDDDDAFSNTSESDGELEAMNIANADDDDDNNDIMSDEECDVFILDPHEVVYFKKLKEEKKKAKQMEAQQQEKEEGLESDFPSLAVAAAVPYDASDDEGELAEEKMTGSPDSAIWLQEEEDRKKKALLPMVNGRVQKNDDKKKQQAYNAFRKYGNIVSADGSAVALKNQKEKEAEEQESKSKLEEEQSNNGDAAAGVAKEEEANTNNNNQGYKSRILGATATSSNSDFPTEMTAEDDDGEGWVTCTRDIQTMKATGSLNLDNNRNNKHGKNNRSHPRKDAGPPICQRAACATTDFAMQNVILQMNLELLSVDGVRVRRLKTWVTRCGACFTIYGNDTGGVKGGGGRLFCDKCGSNTLQRVAASVDRNTGRLKLHMKKNYQYNTRGTKFNLPKAGKGNKYEGDILLAEDQLLYGAWNQKVRKGKSKSSGQSIFGSDLASDMGCIADLTKRDDIRVGFGRRNPNSTKFGRERRGKKKKGVEDKACGLRRY